MTECPYCRTAVGETDLFCRSCGANQRLPEFDRAFCPHCGARVSNRQWFCHECKWPLEPEADGEPMAVPEAPTRFPWLTSRWGWGGLAGLALVLVAAVWWFWGAAPSPPPKAVPAEQTKVITPAEPVPEPAATPAPIPSPPAPPPAPPPKAEVARPEADAAAKTLPRQLALALDVLREGQLKKDVRRYNQAYSPAFPDLAKKRALTQKNWKNYDYTDLAYQLEEVKAVNERTAVARVTWKAETRQRSTRKVQTSTQSYKVWFIKESRGWRIINVEQTARP
jgi:type IV secretory pathway VirB10-like protein